MNPIVKKDILKILENAIIIIKENKVFKLRDLSDNVIHNASIFQDEDSILIAVLIYVLSKVYRDSDKLTQEVQPSLENAIINLKNNNYQTFSKTIKKLINIISGKDIEKKIYFNEVLKRAQIKKGSKIFDHGISIAQVANKLGISQWDLMNYIGKTTIPDTFDESTDVANRLSFTRGLFKK